MIDRYNSYIFEYLLDSLNSLQEIGVNTFQTVSYFGLEHRSQCLHDFEVFEHRFLPQFSIMLRWDEVLTLLQNPKLIVDVNHTPQNHHSTTKTMALAETPTSALTTVVTLSCMSPMPRISPWDSWDSHLQATSPWSKAMPITVLPAPSTTTQMALAEILISRTVTVDSTNHTRGMVLASVTSAHSDSTASQSRSIWAT